MDQGAPMPQIALQDGTLLVAYIVAQPDEPLELEEYAVVKFEGVVQHTFGYPNDEALQGHPLFTAELRLYSFNRLKDSPYLFELGQRNALVFPGTEQHYVSYSHWIVPFHDETLEVVAQRIGYAGSVAANSAAEALSQYAA